MKSYSFIKKKTHLFTWESPDAGLGCSTEISATAISKLWSHSLWFCSGSKCRSREVIRDSCFSQVWWLVRTHTCSLGRGTLGRSLCKTSRHSACVSASAFSFSCEAAGRTRWVKETEKGRGEMSTSVTKHPVTVNTGVASARQGSLHPLSKLSVKQLLKLRCVSSTDQLHSDSLTGTWCRSCSPTCRPYEKVWKFCWLLDIGTYQGCKEATSTAPSTGCRRTGLACTPAIGHIEGGHHFVHSHSRSAVSPNNQLQSNDSSKWFKN